METSNENLCSDAEQEGQGVATSGKKAGKMKESLVYFDSAFFCCLLVQRTALFDILVMTFLRLGHCRNTRVTF